MTRHDIFAMINKERIRQNKKWGFPQNITLSQFMVVLGEEYGECCKEVCELSIGLLTSNEERLKKELIEVAAVCVEIIETLELRKSS